MLNKLYNSDRGLIAISFILLCFGLIMVYSSSAIFIGEIKKDSFFFLKKQFLWVCISFVFFMFFLSVDYRYLQKFAWPSLGFISVLLVLLLFFGKEVRGAKRWFDLGPFDFQPSEFAKFVVVLVLANYFDTHKSKLGKISYGLIFPMMISGFVSLLILIEPDMGTPIVIILTSFLLFFVAGTRIKHLLIGILFFIPFLVLATLTQPYRVERFIAFLNPWKYEKFGYQLRQSLISIGSGGIFGKGLGKSEIKEFFLPDAHTDFVFSIIGEELGLFGTVFIILAFGYLLLRGYRISKNADSFFGTLLAIGITSLIVIQAYIHIAVCSGCLPTKGIPLPFFSYGGSSLVFTLSSIGVVANISQYRRKTVRLFFR